MKHPSLYTLILLAVIHHSISSSVVIECPVTNKDQDGVYLYRKGYEKNSMEKVMYYYVDGTLTPEDQFKDRLETNKDLGNFSVILKNVSKHDSGVYWCEFNKSDKTETSNVNTSLLVQCDEDTVVVCSDESKLIFWAVTGGLSFFILVLLIILVKLCCDRREYTPRQEPSHGVYEVMRGNTRKALINPAYESGRR